MENLVDKMILTMTLMTLTLFGFRSALPYVPALALVGVYLFAFSIVLLYHITSTQSIRRIGEVARAHSLLTKKEVKEILYCQKSCGGLFGEVAVKRNLLTREQLTTLLSLQPVPIS